MLNLQVEKEIALSIIIVNYNSRKYLERCLSALGKKIGAEVNFETIVVNNGPADELIGLVEQFPFVNLLQNEKNDGFGGASNRGAAAARGKTLLFLNPDTELISGGISAILDKLEADRSIGIIGPKLLSSDGKTQEWIAGKEPDLGRIVLNNLGFARDRKLWESPELCLVDWVAGTALFVRRELFSRLGGFDEDFFLYFEDVDLCRRARLLGQQVIFFPDFSLKHHSGKSFADKKSQKRDYYHSQDRYFAKHKGPFQAKLLQILRFFSF